MVHDRYENPLCTRYASERMQRIFSPDYKFLTWHRLGRSRYAAPALAGGA